MNRYPAPLLLGWKGKGEMDAAETHLAKLRTIQKYLQAIPPEEDDDLVLIIDGYDIMLQLPVEIMIERYFRILTDADARLAERFNMTVDELHGHGMRNTIFWGPDKLCWPVDWTAPRCWAVPNSHLGGNAFGPNQGDGGMATNDPKWLNSGTVIGPVGDMRTYINATMVEITRTYDENFENSESDQYYLANVWGRQEYHRSQKLLELNPENAPPNSSELLKGDDEHILPDPVVPGEQAEFHVAIEYESALFQTKAGYEHFFGYMQFDQPGNAAHMEKDMFEEGSAFVPYFISMPAAVYAALVRVYEAAVSPTTTTPAARRSAAPHRSRRRTSPDATETATGDGDDDANDDENKIASRSRLPADEWIRTVKLGVNFVTRHIYALWHCTGGKDPIEEEYTLLWFYPFVASLLRANALASRAGEELTAAPMDGRAWLPKLQYPADDLRSPAPGGEYGGVFTDYEDESFISFGNLCGEWQEKLFAGEMGPPKEE